MRVIPISIFFLFGILKYDTTSRPVNFRKHYRFMYQFYVIVCNRKNPGLDAKYTVMYIFSINDTRHTNYNYVASIQL